MRNSTLLIAGGGTGGHVLAGIAISEEWRKTLGADARVLFIGARGGLEEKLVPKAGLPLELLSIGALNRVGFERRVKTLFLLPVALLRAFWILIRESPRGVIGVGGYASGPVLIAASVLSPFFRFKTAILEQNSVPGLTNRWLGRVVKRVFAAFPGTEPLFPKGKTEIAGNPIRSAFGRLPPASPSPFRIFIFGGSQGAMGLNTLILEALPALKEMGSSLSILHQAGEKDFDRVKAGYGSAGVPARVEKYIYGMKEAYEEASLVVCRSGSSSLFELARVGRASILVPLPTASDDHQTSNANALERLGGAILFPQAAGKGAELAELIRSLIADPSRLRKMEEAATGLDRPDAASRIVRFFAERAPK